MTRTFGLFLAAGIVCVCTAQAQTMPVADVAGGTLAVSETDDAGKVVHRTGFILTELPARTCLGGDWKQAVVLDNDDGFVADPAYRQTGARIEILLVGNVCDAYGMYAGELRGGVFDGQHVDRGRGGHRVAGRVKGVYLRADAAFH